MDVYSLPSVGRMSAAGTDEAVRAVTARQIYGNNAGSIGSEGVRRVGSVIESGRDRIVRDSYEIAGADRAAGFANGYDGTYARPERDSHLGNYGGMNLPRMVAVGEMPSSAGGFVTSGGVGEGLASLGGNIDLAA